MARRSWSVQDAKNRFSQLVEAARRLDVAEYERLRHLERAQAPSFVDALLAMPQDDGDFPRRHVRMRDLDL